MMFPDGFEELSLQTRVLAYREGNDGVNSGEVLEADNEDMVWTCVVLACMVLIGVASDVSRHLQISKEALGRCSVSGGRDISHGSLQSDCLPAEFHFEGESLVLS